MKYPQPGYYESARYGLLLRSPTPPPINVEQKSRSTYKEVFQESEKLVVLLTNAGIPIDKSSDMKELLDSSKILASEWERNQCRDLNNGGLLAVGLNNDAEDL